MLNYTLYAKHSDIQKSYLKGEAITAAPFGSEHAVLGYGDDLVEISVPAPEVIETDTYTGRGMARGEFRYYRIRQQKELV